jgi:hypothetical protein
MLLLFFSAAAFAELKAESLTWLDVEETIDTNTGLPVDAGGQFYIGREYITLSGDIGKDWFGNSIKGRVTLDPTKSATPIKYAYFDWTILKTSYSFVHDEETNTVNQNSIVLSGGLMKSYFGNLAFWEYPIPVKDATENYSVKPGASADFGLMLSGKLFPIDGLTSSLFSYYIQMLNGEKGYETIYSGSFLGTNADAFVGQASAFISPLDGFLIGGSYRAQDYNSVTGNNETSYAIVATAKDVMGIPVDFVAQYIMMNSTNMFGKPGVNGANNFNGVVYTVSLGYGLFEGAFTPYIRYDAYDQNTASDKTNDSGSLFYIGANIKLDSKNMSIKPLYTMYLTEKDQPTGGKFNIKLEFEYKLNFSIWQ